MSLLLLDRSHIGPLSVPVYYAVCGRVAFKVSPNLTKHWVSPGNNGGRGADLSLSDGRAIAGGMSVDTGTLERVANWSPDRFVCDPGTDPRKGLFAGIPYGGTFLTLSCTVSCSRPGWYAATCPTRWPRSVS